MDSTVQNHRTLQINCTRHSAFSNTINVRKIIIINYFLAPSKTSAARLYRAVAGAEPTRASQNSICQQWSDEKTDYPVNLTLNIILMALNDNIKQPDDKPARWRFKWHARYLPGSPHTRGPPGTEGDRDPGPWGAVRREATRPGWGLPGPHGYLLAPGGPRAGALARSAAPVWVGWGNGGRTGFVLRPGSRPCPSQARAGQYLEQS